MINTQVIFDNQQYLLIGGKEIEFRISSFQVATALFQKYTPFIEGKDIETVLNCLKDIQSDFTDFQLITNTSKGLISGYKFLRSYNSWKKLYVTLFKGNHSFLLALLAVSLIDLPSRKTGNIFKQMSTKLRLFLQTRQFTKVSKEFGKDMVALFMYLSMVHGFLFYLDNILQDNVNSFESYDIQDVDQVFNIYDVICNSMNIRKINGVDLDLNNFMSTLNYSQFYIFAKVGSVKKTLDSISVMGVSEDGQKQLDNVIAKTRSFNFSSGDSAIQFPMYLGYVLEENRKDEYLFDSDFGERLKMHLGGRSKIWLQYTKHKEAYKEGKFTVKRFVKK